MTAEELARYRKELERQLSELSEASSTREQILDDSLTTGDTAGAELAADLESFKWMPVSPKANAIWS